MVDQNKHIVSKVSWDTTCYEKELAVPLQNEISDWSKARMESEIKSVLDELCPDDQVWKIDSLELDLGIIAYTDLKNGLSSTFSKALSDQLRSLLFSTVGQEAKMKVSNVSDSYFIMLRSYLEKGYMPWWHKQENGNAKELASHLLKNHQLALVQMIRKLGQSADVRKRLAWQFEDGILQKIVEGIDPYNHTVLLAFKNDLTDIQAKEHIVQSSNSYFGKETWLWLLTYLLVERGTLFSIADFVESMINQLASRFDLKYNEVVNRIKRAFEKEKNRNLSQSDFEAVISALSKEKTKAVAQVKESKHWQLLNGYFDDHITKDEAASVSQVKDLLTTLSIKEQGKFQTWLLKLKEKPEKWKSLLEMLDQTTYASIISSFNSTYSDSIVANTKLIGDVLSENSWLANRRKLWNIGLDYAIQNSNVTSPKSFVEYLIKAFSRQEKIDVDQILNGFQSSSIWAQSKTNRRLKLFEELIVLQQEPNETFNSEVFENRIRDLLNQIRKVGYRIEDAIPHYDQLNRWIVSNPGHVSRILKDYFTKEGLPDLLLRHLNSNSSEKLINHIGEDFGRIIEEFEEQWLEINKDKKILNSLTNHHESIISHAIRLLFKNPTSTKKEFVRGLVKELSRTMTQQELHVFQGCFQEMVSVWDQTSLAFSKPELKRMEQWLATKKEEDFLIKTHELISERSSNQVLVGSFLLANCDHAAFAKARDVETEDLDLILNYFVHDGVRVKRAMIQKAMGNLQIQVKKFGAGRVEHDLTNLFWKCVLSYKDYWGHVETLKKSFEHAIAFSYNRNPHLIKASQVTESNSIVLSSGTAVTHNQLKNIVLKGIYQAKLRVNYSQKEYVLGECITQLIRRDLNGFEGLLRKVTITENRIVVLMNGIDFGDFALHFQSKPKYRQSFEALRSLYLLVKQQAPKELLEKFLMHLWRQAWEVLEAGTLNTKAYTSLVSSAILEIHSPDERDPAVILQDIQTSGIPINSIFKTALVKASEVFELWPDAEEVAVKMKGMDQCEAHGLIEPLFNATFSNKNVPAWFSSSNDHGLEETINELAKRYPMEFLQQLKDTLKTERDMEWLASQMTAETLVHSITLINPNLSIKLDSMLKMHDVFETLSVGLPKTQVQQIIIKKMLVAWSNDHWDLLSSDNIWNELMWEVCIKRGVDSHKFKSVVGMNLERFPSGLQLSFRQVAKEEEQLKKASIPEYSTELIEEQVSPQNVPLIKDGMAVKNAGLVLLFSYVKMLFEKLNLLDGDNFKNQENQQKAVHYLQYVVTGLSETEESLLVLNKVICGLHPTTPITYGIDITDKDKELVAGLIKAMIGYWKAIGETSIDGFRGNWLVRDGILTEEEDRWELSVDKRPYDLLIERSPFSFSIIKYPWMDKPIHVTWPY